MGKKILLLTCEERRALPLFMPQEGGMSEQLLCKSILDKSVISLTEKEKLHFDSLYQGKIDPETDFEKEVEFEDAEFDLLYSEFLQKDKAKKINSITVSLALKIREAASKGQKEVAKK